MTRVQMANQFNSLLNDMGNIMQAKNQDYSGSAEDPFTNFNMIELVTKGEISRAQGCLVRMTDKLSRTHRLLTREAAVKTETIEDTLIDLANYSLLLILMLRDTNAKGKITQNTNNDEAS